MVLINISFIGHLKAIVVTIIIANKDTKDFFHEN